MADKKCPKCNAVNPGGINIHYCGMCGHPLDIIGGRPVSYSVVTDYELKSLKDNYDSIKQKYERLERNESLLRRERNMLQARLDRSWAAKLSKWWDDDGLPIVLIAAVVLTPILLVYLMSHCGSEEISRIEVDGKYGIGTGKDHLVVPAKYDSISAKPTGKQWVLMDKKAGTRGLAYISGDTVNIIEPKYTTNYAVWTNGTAVLERQDKTKDIAYNGQIVNSDPFKGVRYTPNFAKGGTMVVTYADDTQDIYGPNGQPVTQSHYSNIYIVPDTMLIVEYRKGKKYYSALYDHYGRKVNDKEYSWVGVYSDGVAWVNINDDDEAHNRYSLIDRKGNVLFKTAELSYDPREYSEGIGWYRKRGESEWTAVDKTGKKVGSTTALVKGPVTMGLTPVEKDYKLGFIDLNGRQVIPCKYRPVTTNYAFGRDSTIRVRLDGVEGKLHRNGTFTPKEK